MNTPETSSLGRETVYPNGYDASLLFPIPRAQARQSMGIQGALPFHGVDIWNGYELSWLTPSGKPVVAIARFSVPATSPNLIESKSFKLYLGGFASTRMEDATAVSARLIEDLSAAAGEAVGVTLTPMQAFAQETVSVLEGECIDDTEVTIDTYGPPRPEFLTADDEHLVEETLVSHLLKSNCPVTGQPDWASVQIAYHGPRIDRAGLVRYLVSYREHNDFHEQCVEKIFCDVMTHCRATALTVYARYTRRGGLDINPWRSTQAGTPPNPRLARQ